MKTVTVAILLSAASSQAATVAYDNLGTNPTAGYTDLNTNNPIFGDALNLTAGGTLATFGLSLFNSSSGGNTGSILTGTTVVKFYDNTVPYSGGTLTDPLLGTASINWDFIASGGLAPGFFTTSITDLSAFNIVLPQNIFVTQQFTENSGASTRNGIVLFGNPTVGSSPANVYIKSSATPEGLYSFSNNPNQFGYQVQVQTALAPEPSTLLLAGLAAALLISRRRKF